MDKLQSKDSACHPSVPCVCPPCVCACGAPLSNPQSFKSHRKLRLVKSKIKVGPNKEESSSSALLLPGGPPFVRLVKISNMSLVRFCSRAIVRNRPNCISPSATGVFSGGVGRGSQPSSSSWLVASAAAAASDKCGRRDYHSSAGGKSPQKDVLEQFTTTQRGMATQAPPPPTGVVGQRDPLNTGFADPVAAFKSKTLIELIRAYAVYMICSSGYLVENNMKVSGHGYIPHSLVNISSYVSAVE